MMTRLTRMLFICSLLRWLTETLYPQYGVDRLPGL
jgi:hypothetical protein